MAEKVSKNKVKFKWVWIAVAIVLILVGQFGPLWSPDLSREGQSAIMVLLAAVVMWATEALPLPITSLVMVALCGFLGVAAYNTIWAATFTSSLWMFVGIFGFTTFLGVSTFPQRLIAMVVRMTKGNINLVILGFMVISAIISTVMSNIALTAIMMGFAASLLRAAGAEKGKSNMGRCLALAIPFAVMFGGCLLPSGTPINVVVLGLAESACGVTITFAEWFGYTIIPVALSLVACWFILIKVYKPEPLSDETVKKFLDEVSALPPMDFKEKFNIGVLVVALVCWIASSWLPILNTTFVALFALGLLFLPGTSMITTKQYRSESPWDILLMMASINGIVAGRHLRHELLRAVHGNQRGARHHPQLLPLWPRPGSARHRPGHRPCGSCWRQLHRDHRHAGSMVRAVLPGSARFCASGFVCGRLLQVQRDVEGRPARHHRHDGVLQRRSAHPAADARRRVSSHNVLTLAVA